MVHVYILRSKRDGSYYIGHTKNIEDRVYRHNMGQSISTKFGVPWEIVYTEKVANRAEAVKRERKIKAEKSRRYIENLVKRGVAQFG